MTRWLWYISAGVSAAAVLVLVIGLATLAGDAKADQQADAANKVEDARKGEDAREENKGESPLVAAARGYLNRSNPPPVTAAPPVVPQPVEEPKVEVETPPPPPAPPAQAPPPTFALEATLVIGETGGLVWLRGIPGQPEPILAAVGEEVDGYKLNKVGDGYAEFTREGTSFKLEVPPPLPVVASGPVPPVMPAGSPPPPPMPPASPGMIPSSPASPPGVPPPIRPRPSRRIR